MAGLKVQRRPQRKRKIKKRNGLWRQIIKTNLAIWLLPNPQKLAIKEALALSKKSMSKYLTFLNPKIKDNASD